jgi:predicted nucleic acid-binding protein
MRAADRSETATSCGSSSRRRASASRPPARRRRSATRGSTQHCARRGARSTNDLWIAASSMEHGAELVTLDRDFGQVPQILVAVYAWA